jgi:hypothetical protein
MEHLRKQYAYFFGEIIHPEKISQNFLYHFQNLSQKYLFPEYYTTMKNQQIQSFCWFFFELPSFKIKISNEEERFNFNY